MTRRRIGPWVRLAAGFYHSPKVAQLAHDRHHRAIAAYACALAWCGDHYSDGFIPAYALAAVHATTTEAAQLVAVGLWEATAGGWLVHDWDEWQESDEDRRKRSETMRARANIRHHGHPEGPASNVRKLT